MTTRGSTVVIVEESAAVQELVNKRCAYLSGRADEAAGPEPGPTLRTPFSLEELRAAIAARLDRSESGASV